MTEDDPTCGQILTAIARAEIAGALGLAAKATTDADWLHLPGACFVTLTCDGKLRGCIGTIDPHRSLGDDVRANARAAAFRDPRFSPLTVAEFARTHIEVSVLTPREPLVHASQADALAQLRPGIDGVVLEFGRHRATFLPQVWEQLPERDAFMAQLMHKAGLPETFWDCDIRLYRYRVRKWSEAPDAGTAP